MALIENFTINHIRLAIWQIEESIPELYEQVHLNEEETERYNRFYSDRRKREWLATRVLMRQIGIQGKINYLPNGKPFLLEPYHISISHSHDRVFIGLSEKEEIAVDVELVREKIFRIQDKFSSPSEISKLPDQDAETMTIVWGAKEVLYKKYSVIESLEFKSQMTIAIDEPINGKGFFRAQVHGTKVQGDHQLSYFIEHGYVHVYLCD
ncbi:hypothetical protein KFE98_10820 [bacterium SCSIO 12741]|nr:hypothetical protein KFE98_10820 [bacterium SCSIO 12741]